MIHYPRYLDNNHRQENANKVRKFQIMVLHLSSYQQSCIKMQWHFKVLIFNKIIQWDNVMLITTVNSHIANDLFSLTAGYWYEHVEAK